MDKTVIGIDHGNGNLKTPLCVFPCGYRKQAIEPAGIFADDVLYYKGSYYTLTDQKIPYKVDKTMDDSCFILTLFGIAKEILKRAERDNKRIEKYVGREVNLSIGLPPAHFEMKMKSFADYFRSNFAGGVEFKFNGTRFFITVPRVFVYPQDYAAAIVYMQDIIKTSKTYCIDIGDGTVDLLALKKDGIPDKSVMISRELGASVLRNKIIDEVINDYSFTLDQETIDSVLRGDNTFLDLDIAARIKQEAAEWTQNISDQLHTKVPEFRNAPTIFCGGGSLMLRPYIEKIPYFGKTYFIEDISANALGYQILAEAQLNEEARRA